MTAFAQARQIECVSQGIQPTDEASVHRGCTDQGGRTSSTYSLYAFASGGRQPVEGTVLSYTF